MASLKKPRGLVPKKACWYMIKTATESLTAVMSYLATVH